MKLSKRRRKIYLDKLNDRLGNCSSCILCVMPSSNDPIKKLSAFAELHDKINCLLIFIRLLEPNDIWVGRQPPHYLHFPPHVRHVDLRPQFPL